MAHIIHLYGDPHDQTQSLLPWYANGTLDEAEVALVEAHLVDCPECRADLAFERALGLDVSDPPTDAERGWAALSERLKAAAPRRGWGGGLIPRGELLRRPIPISWALAAQAAMVVLTLSAVWAWQVQSPTRPVAAYRALGAPQAAAPGNVVVIFRPTTTEQDLRHALLQSGARLVDGPTASDAYVLRVPEARREGALVRLRSDAHVVLAEPINGDARP